MHKYVGLILFQTLLTPEMQYAVTQYVVFKFIGLETIVWLRLTQPCFAPLIEETRPTVQEIWFIQTFAQSNMVM